MEKSWPTILVVTTEPLLRHFFVDLLAPQGYAVECVDPAASLARVAVGNVDLVLLDLGWPEAAGVELCCHMRAQSSVSHTPVVALTELPQDSLAVTAYAVGPDEYLSKPFDVNALLATVARYCPPPR